MGSRVFIRIRERDQLAPATALPELGEAQVARDAVEPGAKGRFTAEARQRLVSPQEHLLAQVLAVSSSDEPRHEATHTMLVPIDELGERLIVTPPAADRQGFVIEADQ